MKFFGFIMFGFGLLLLVGFALFILHMFLEWYEEYQQGKLRFAREYPMFRLPPFFYNARDGIYRNREEWTIKVTRGTASAKAMCPSGDMILMDGTTMTILCEGKTIQFSRMLVVDLLAAQNIAARNLTNAKTAEYTIEPD